MLSYFKHHQNTDYKRKFDDTKESANLTFFKIGTVREAIETIKHENRNNRNDARNIPNIWKKK